MKKIFLTFLLTLIFSISFSQHSKPDTLIAFRTDKKIKFDGILDDAVWHNAMKISNFTQRELNFGQPASEKTQVAVAYDKNNLYFGIWCYQKEAKITAKFLSPDFNIWADDNFRIMISPYDDNRTGYMFVVNPNGARADFLIFGPEDGSMDWNGVWDARATITDSGWFAEVIIPFNTLQFKRKNQMVWALNFERDIMAKNEEDLWQGWSRDYSIFAVSKAGKLAGLENISYTKRFEFKPYVLLGRSYDKNNGTDYPVKAGGDLNVYLSPTLKLNLTSFTDFAQVEADRIPVNLSRFAVYYPEKRQFFLEGSDYFDFYLGDRNTAFYSRQIGIENFQQVPILAGARLFGKIGKNKIGFLNMQEKAVDSLPSTNNTVLRYQREIGKQSTVGFIFTNVADKNHSNQILGFDATYQTSEFLKNKNLTLSARYTQSFENFQSRPDAYTYRISLDYPNDLIDNFMAYGVMTENFNPELGFIRRHNYDSYSWYFRIMPRWFTNLGVKRLLLKPWGFTAYYTHSTGELESFYNETRPLGAVFKSGERFEINFKQNYERLDEPFYFTDTIAIPQGKYWMYNHELQFETYHARRLWIASAFNWGGFYTGKIKSFETELGINFGKHLNLTNGYVFNHIVLPQATINTHELATYLNLAFNTRLNLSIFTQLNTLDKVLFYNIRLHWIPKIGSDFYLVYNFGYDEPYHLIDLRRPSTTTAALKFVYRITF